MNIQKRDQQILSEFKQKIPGNVAASVKKVIVFGSRAHGKGNDDSDLDVVVLLERRLPGIEKILEDAAYDTMWDFDFKPIISLKIFLESQFQDLVSRGFSFYKHVQNEGVPL